LAEKTRVHQLAKSLGVTSKAILEKCRAEGLDLKNHMSTLSAGLEETVREWFSEGAHATALETAEKVDLKKVRVKKRPTRRKKAAAPTTEQPATAVAEAAPPEVAAAAEAEPATVAAEAPAEVAAEAPPQEVVAEAPPTVEPVEAPAAEPVAPVPEEKSEPLEPEPVMPAGPRNVPAPAVLRGPKVVRVETAEPRTLRRPAARAPQAGPPAGAETVSPPTARRGRGRGGGQPQEGESAEAAKRGKSRVHPRRSANAGEVGERLKEWRDQDLVERQERLAAATGRGMRQRRAASTRRTMAGPTVAVRQEKVQVAEPITVGELCRATGVGHGRIRPKLVEHGVFVSITQIIETELAELVALEFGIELTVIKRKSAFEALAEQFAAHERKNVESRPPVVTMLGHVDHGKTSLLDRIRQTAVAEGEAGGITQHIGAYQVEKGEVRVTFIDTPGHEAFTSMRARGAQMTDVVVLVVAADDGVMPQTIEAINHAQAAEVPVLVALNKIDLPGLDTNRVYSQLAEHGLVPQEWGGEVDVIKTSAETGEGVEDLLEHLHTLSELLDLQADPTVPATGIVVEAAIEGGRGAVATLLIQDGTLREGQIVVCGPGFGRVRAMRNDRGRRTKTAGPSVPVTVSGLDELPEAGDHFYQVGDLKTAKSVAEERRIQLRQQSLAEVAKPRTLADLVAKQEAGEVPELSVILRADVQGSVDVLRQQLGELPTEEVRLRILHAGVGAITEGDVLLAQASSAIVIGFGIVAEDRARRLADQVGVEIRLYRIIYEVTDDVKRALEGLLAPEERVELRGQATVREVFNISRVGTVAGCMVTDGQMVRSHLVRVVRDGRIVRDQAQIQSSRHFKDDAREVRAGLECGIKIAGFDDLKPGDVIEDYEVIELARSL